MGVGTENTSPYVRRYAGTQVPIPSRIVRAGRFAAARVRRGHAASKKSPSKQQLTRRLATTDRASGCAADIAAPCARRAAEGVADSSAAASPGDRT